MRLRPATPADLSLIRYWDEQPHVIASDPNDDWQWECEHARNPDWREQLIAEVDGRPVGFVQIIDPAREDSHYWGECGTDLRAIDIWIGEAADLGRGFGSEMMRMAMRRCFDDRSVRAILVDPLASNARAQRFYRRLGFRFVEERRFGGRSRSADRCGWPGYGEAGAPTPARAVAHNRFGWLRAAKLRFWLVRASQSLRARGCR